MSASLFSLVDSATDQLEDAFWSLLHSTAEQAETPPADVLHYFKRTAIERLKALKPSHGIDRVDDGRAAFWRFRVMLWAPDPKSGREELVTDSDPERRRDARGTEPGATVIAGLPNVAREVLGMLLHHHAQHDPGCTVEGISEPVLLNKIRSLRVALSHQGHECMWRLRYVVHPPANPEPPVRIPGSLRGLERASNEPRHYRADVLVSREVAAR